MLQLSYILLFVALLSIILWIVNIAMKRNGTPSPRRNRTMTVIAISVLSWVAIQFAVWKTGFYYDLSLPPRIPLFMILPLFLFTGIFLYRNRNNSILNAIPIYLPIAYQSFRAFIELLFYFTFLRGILPVQVTFEGANYDVLLGISAIFMGLYAYRANASKKVLIAWNIIGIGVVAFAAFTFITSFYFPSIWVNTAVSEEFNQFPYLLLPTFFMPSAIFMHILSIIQLRNMSGKTNSYKILAA